MSLIPSLDSLQAPTTMPTWAKHSNHTGAFVSVAPTGLKQMTRPENVGTRGSWKQHHLLGSLRGPGVTQRSDPAVQAFLLQPYQVPSTASNRASLQEDWSDLPISKFA